MRPPGSQLYLAVTRKGAISTFSTSNCIHIHNVMLTIYRESNARVIDCNLSKLQVTEV